MVLGPNILSKGVEIGPTTTQFDLACAQTIPRLPRAHLRQAEFYKESKGNEWVVYGLIKRRKKSD